jgi:hypothetical protein
MFLDRILPVALAVAVIVAIGALVLTPWLAVAPPIHQTLGL